MSLVYGSVCSGIEAATVAWHPLGWRPAFYSEIDKFPRAVLAHHYPATPLHGDFTTIREGEYDAIDVLVGGTPCQSFSVAGLRGGMADARGNLALQYLALASRLRPRWLVWENVPGVLSSNGGRDFGSFLGGLVELGYGFAYRVLDAQYFNLAQRRARVFVVGYLGDWRRAGAVLFERESLSGNPAPRRQTGERPAPTISARPTGGGGLGTDFDCDGGLTAGTLNANGKAAGSATSQDAEGGLLLDHSLRADGFDASEDGTGRGTPLVPVPNHPEIPDSSIISFSAKDHGADAGEIAPTLRAGGHNKSHANAGVMPAISSAMSVRRLTPSECERLQGFPGDYTLIPYRNGFAADGPRYKALGNSMAVPCMRWIGERIALVDELAALSTATRRSSTPPLQRQ